MHSLDPANLLSGIYLKKTIVNVPGGTKMFNTALFITLKKLKNEKKKHKKTKSHKRKKINLGD